jgi:hypothetical protein
MHPDGIRQVFAEKHDQENTVQFAILCALLQLKGLSKRARSRSPYSLAKLTAGLPHREEILARAMVESEANNLES